MKLTSLTPARGLYVLVKITVLLDEHTVSSKLKKAPGLSMYVEYEDTYLVFDLGGNEKALQHNIEVLNTDLDVVDAAIISHAHADHVAGIPVIGWLAPYLTVYIPYGSTQTLGKLAKSNGLKPVEVTKWVNLRNGVYISAPFNGPPWEHFLVLDTVKGLVVLSGCMHPGVDVVLDGILKYFNYSKKIHSVVGGFHLATAPESVVENTVKKLVEKYNVDLIVPLHCSGSLFKKLLSEKHPDRYVEAGAGSSIEL